MKSILLFAISLLFFSHTTIAQIVWPGDVNNNGIVNEVDFLYLGFAYGEIGTARVIQNTDWAAQEINELWGRTFPNGLDFAYADCNGDGLIDAADATIIQKNLTNTHNDVAFMPDEILMAEKGIDPSFSFLNEDLTVQPGGSIDLNIALGNNELPVEKLQGLSFNINVNPKFFNNSSTQFTFDPVAWVSPFGNQNNQLITKEDEKGKVRVGFTTTDKKAVSGAGLIGTVSFVIQEDIIDFLEKDDTLKVEIDSIIVVTDSLKKIPIAGATAILEVEGRPTSTYDPILDKIKLYPNPTTGWVLLKTNDIEVEQIALVNTLGQTIYQRILDKKAFHGLDFQTIPKGAYWLQMISKHGIKSIAIHKQ